MGKPATKRNQRREHDVHRPITNNVSQRVVNCQLQACPVTRCQQLSTLFLAFRGIDRSNCVDHMGTVEPVTNYSHGNRWERRTQGGRILW